MPLTESQVAKARTFPGCNDITADNAVDKLFAAAEHLQTTAATQPAGNSADALKVKSLEGQLDTLRTQVPKQTPPEVLKAMAGAARTYMEVAVEKQACAPVVAEQLAARLIGSDDAPSSLGLTPSASGECVATAVFKILAGNTPMPLVGREPTGQAAPRATPGAPADKEPTESRVKELLGMTTLGQATLNPASHNGNGRH